ncbi:nucleotidyltransferase domain-containing protein [Candidatus Peregrinibacteria bacterium]|nr:nucleotidyltransferase domain-containing protein [Candidatus Peregrinibacteria bacterium]
MIDIRSKIEKELLAYYFLNITAKHYLQELARLLKLNPGNLDKKLKQLEEKGLFLSEWRGNHRVYFLNRDFPLFREYQRIINKTYGIEGELKKALKTVPKIQEAYIFGSYAGGSFDSLSDIDLLVIGEHDPLVLSKALNKLESRFSREINVVEMAPDEKNPFLAKILSGNKIQII